MSLCYSQLTLPDRKRLFHLRERKVSVSEIARQLGRHRSTIYRELKRNTFQDHEFPEYSGYYSGIANDMSKERRRRLRKLRRHPHLRDLVIDRLKAHWSPEQIAGRLLADGVSPVRICPETIYRFIYCKEDYRAVSAPAGTTAQASAPRRTQTARRLNPARLQNLPTT